MYRAGTRQPKEAGGALGLRSKYQEYFTVYSGPLHHIQGWFPGTDIVADETNAVKHTQ